jgi:uncharacterized protein (TIGR02466 family)
LDNFTVFPLWATPIYVSSLECKDEIKASLKELKYERVLPNNGWWSEEKKVLNIPQFYELKHKILHHITKYINECIEIDANNIEFYFSTSWVMKHKMGDSAQEHIHVNSIFSGIYYFEVDDVSGMLGFKKNLSLLNLFTPTIDFDVKNWNLYNCKSWVINPTKDMLIIFPSHVTHYVTHSYSENLRYCLAFNVFVRGDISKEASELNL